MQIVPLTKEKYEEWDKFCLKSDDAWFWHTTKWLEYTLNYKPELKTESKAFMVMKGSEIIAICPITIETIILNGKKFKEFSFGNSPIGFPAFKKGMKKKHRKKIETMIFKYVDELAEKNVIARASFRCSPLSPSFLESRFPQNNVVMEYGYNDISLNTSIVDLTKSLDKVKESFRRNHKRMIEKASHLKLKTFDKNNITKKKYEEYIDMHHRDAGYVTRPQLTFDMMYDWILKGNAVLFELDDSNPIGFFYVYIYKDRAYSGSCCNEPTYTEFGVQHILNWHAIRWLVKNNFKYFELGLQKYGYIQYSFPSPKEINISLFKRGFGTEIVPFFIGEKFYSKEYFLEKSRERNNQFLKVFEKSEDKNGQI